MTKESGGSPDELDLGAYLERIGAEASGPRGAIAPTLETLRALSAAHVSAIPFENVDVLLDRPIQLEPEALFDKLICRKRGGYCFEQNGLFLEVLRAIGFDVTPRSARVRLGHPRDVLPPRTHVFLRVVIDGRPWLADVGVGAASLTSPLRLDEPEAQPTPHETRRIVHEDGRWFHQILHGETWVDVYEFTGEEMPLVDRVVASWYTSAHPRSHFKGRLMVARALPEGRRATLNNLDFTIRDAAGQAATTSVESPRALLEVLQRELCLETLTEADAERLFAVGANAAAEPIAAVAARGLR